MSGARGELRTSVLVNPGPDGGQLERLDTRWQTQAPGPLQTLVVGDTFGSGGGWSRPVRFGGVRFGRGLTLRPGFVVAPQGGVHGSAALPSSRCPWSAPTFVKPVPQCEPCLVLDGRAPRPVNPASCGLASDSEVETGRLQRRAPPMTL
jgi:hypothetical protein